MTTEIKAPAHETYRFNNITTSTGLMSLEVLQQIVELREHEFKLIRDEFFGFTMQEFYKMKFYYLTQHEELDEIGEHYDATNDDSIIDGINTQSYTQMMSGKKRFNVDRLHKKLNSMVCDLATTDHKMVEVKSAVSGKREFSIVIDLSFNSMCHDSEVYKTLKSYELLNMTDAQADCLRRACIISALDAYIMLIDGSVKHKRNTHIDVQP